jgi:hypothetical protein
MSKSIHDDISLIRFVIPGSTRNPVFFWIPAFAGMTAFAMINVAVYKCQMTQSQMLLYCEAPIAL